MPCSDINELEELLQTLRQSKTIQHINLLVNGNSRICQCEDGKKCIDDITFINVDNPNASRTLLEVEANTDAEYVLLNLKATPVNLGQHALDLPCQGVYLGYAVNFVAEKFNPYRDFRI